MGFSSDLSYSNKALKFSKKQAELTKEIAAKYGLQLGDVISIQAEFGKFVHNRIENNFEVIFFAQFGKFIPLMQKRVGHKFENKKTDGSFNTDNSGGQEEENQTLPNV